MYMERIEWAGFLRTLQLKFEEIAVAKRGGTEQRNRNQALYIWQDHWSYISSIFFKLDVHSRAKTVQEAVHMDMMINTISNLK